jgi:hypothetical protein
MMDDFQFYIPAEIHKGGEDNDEMRLKGIASTGHLDQQGEELMPKGLDINYLITKGYINWHHQLKNDPLAIIGVPDPKKTKITPEGLYVEAVLYKSNPMAQKAYEQTKIMESENLGRRMGWSVEGKVSERDPLKKGRVIKASITGIALTPMPINPNTFANICKAFSEGGEFEKGSGSENGGKTYQLSHTLSDDRKSINITVALDKAMTTDSARAVIKEDLEGNIHSEEMSAKKVRKSDLFESIARSKPHLSPKEIVEVADRVIDNLKMKK